MIIFVSKRPFALRSRWQISSCMTTLTVNLAVAASNHDATSAESPLLAHFPRRYWYTKLDYIFPERNKNLVVAQHGRFWADLIKLIFPDLPRWSWYIHGHPMATRSPSPSCPQQSPTRWRFITQHRQQAASHGISISCLKAWCDQCGSTSTAQHDQCLAVIEWSITSPFRDITTVEIHAWTMFRYRDETTTIDMTKVFL